MKKWLCYLFSAVCGFGCVYPFLSLIHNISYYHRFNLGDLDALIVCAFAAWLFFWIGKSFATPEKVKAEFESGVRQRGYKVAMWGMLVLLIIGAIIQSAALISIIIKYFQK